MIRICDRRTFVGTSAAVLASVAFGLVSCSSQNEGAAVPEEQPLPVAVCIDGVPGAAHAGVYLALAKGFFAEHDIDATVERAAEGQRALDVVQKGDAEFGIVSQSVLAQAFGCDEPYSVLAIAALEQPHAGGAQDGYPLLLIANDTYLVRREEDAKLVVDCIRKGYEYAAKDTSRAASELAEALHGQESATIAAQLEDARAHMLGADGTWGKVEQDVWDAYFAKMWEDGRIDNKIPAHHGYSMDYLDEN